MKRKIRLLAWISAFILEFFFISGQISLIFVKLNNCGSDGTISNKIWNLPPITEKPLLSSYFAAAAHVYGKSRSDRKFKSHLLMRLSYRIIYTPFFYYVHAPWQSSDALNRQKKLPVLQKRLEGTVFYFQICHLYKSMYLFYYCNEIMLFPGSVLFVCHQTLTFKRGPLTFHLRLNKL